MTDEEKFLKDWLVQKLRRISYQWPYRKAALRKSRVARGKYKCTSCEFEHFGPKQIVLDHIDPVVDVEAGWVDWNNYIFRLFCAEEGWQVLCKQCHQAKSYLENQIRKEVAEEKKLNKKED